MTTTLLYDAFCPSCSKVARLAREAVGDRLEVRSVHDPDVVAAIVTAGLTVPNGPALLCVEGDGGDRTTTLLRGVAMRLKLARLLGPRRARQALRLIAAEMRARSQRSASGAAVIAETAADRRWRLSRRRALGLAGAGAVGIGLGAAGMASNAEAAPAAAPALAARLLKAAPMRAAVARYGAVDLSTAVETVSSGEHVVMFLHKSGAATVVDAAATGVPTVLSITTTKTSTTEQVRIFAADGTPLTDLTMATTGKSPSLLVTAAPSGTQAAPNAVAAPDVSWVRRVCFANCLAGHVSQTCFNACFSCFTGSMASCAYAAICGGAVFVKCYKGC